MRWHDEMRQQGLLGIRVRGRRRLAVIEGSQFARDAIRPELCQKLQLRASRRRGAAVGEVDDLALSDTVDRSMRRVDETRQPVRKPMIAPRQLVFALHALLHDSPFAVVGDDEAVEIELKAILQRRAVNFCDEPANAGERCTVEADAIGNRNQLSGRLSRMRSASATDINAELILERFKTALQRPDHAGGDAGGMPVHTHYAPERLEPERIRQAPQQFVAAVMIGDSLADNRAKPRHALAKPFRHPPTMQRQIRTARSSRHVNSY